MKHCILCVDDEVDNVDSLERLFRRKYRVIKATSAHDALELLKVNKVTVIISDQRMPQMTGVEFLAASIKTHPDAIRILLTGYTDIDSVVAAINAGQIYRYVTKPWDPVDLTNAIDKAVERFEIGQELVAKNQALETALKELKQLDEAKSQFMILVNHELKTPLTSILSFTELLAETPLAADQSKMVNRVKSSALRLQDMVSDALEYVAAETAQMRFEKKSLAAKKVFAAVNLPDLVQQTANERKVSINIELANEKISGDERLLQNVFRRLMHNAVKFAAPGSEISVTGKEQESGAFLVRIENDGKDIDPATIARILKPFTLNENALNHSVGTGLGLSICQALLKLHGSRLDFQSRGGRVAASFELSPN